MKLASAPVSRGGGGPTALPKLYENPHELRDVVRTAQSAGRRVGLVPTMGALHEGHLSLVDAARSECDLTVASIFVNPTQFAPHEDFAAYPRDLDHDLAVLGQRGCDLVFAPTVETMYPPGHATQVDVGPIAQVLEGEFRPHHFRGVATVVLKLLNLAPADRAYFGRKDYQQTLVIRQMVDDLDVPTEIRVLPIVREADGLAMSSRNRYLDHDQRRQAVELSASLRLAEQLVARGQRDAATIGARIEQRLARHAAIDLQYIALVADGTVTPVEAISGPTVIVLAATVGTTRLIDNTLVGAAVG